MNGAQVAKLLYQALETEQGGANVYRTALQCVLDRELEEQWKEYLEQTKRHEVLMWNVCEVAGLDPRADNPGRFLVRHFGESLVQAIEMALELATPELAQLVAGECVVLAETKDHFNWTLLREVAKHTTGDLQKALSQACDAVEQQEDEHVCQSAAWTRDLWLESLGIERII